jgi:SAM-dependent methyltransferase
MTKLSEISLLKELWAKQLEYVSLNPNLGPSMSYMQLHFGMEITLQRHLRVIDMMAPYIGGRVLEWGCQAALDSCIYRMRYGNSVELYGCDVYEMGAYKPFYDFSGIHYSKIEHPYRLEYQECFFDVATSNGVLEHVPDDLNSVKEIYRILKPGGIFVITCLPNKYSYTELFQRLRNGVAHERLYTLDLASKILVQAGFRTIATRYFFMLPTMLNGFPEKVKTVYQNLGKVIWSANDALERMWFVNRISSNIMIAALKPKN